MYAFRSVVVLVVLALITLCSIVSLCLTRMRAYSLQAAEADDHALRGTAAAGHVGIPPPHTPAEAAPLALENGVTIILSAGDMQNGLERRFPFIKGRGQVVVADGRMGLAFRFNLELGSTVLRGRAVLLLSGVGFRAYERGLYARELMVKRLRFDAVPEVLSDMLGFKAHASHLLTEALAGRTIYRLMQPDLELLRIGDSDLAIDVLDVQVKDSTVHAIVRTAPIARADAAD